MDDCIEDASLFSEGTGDWLPNDWMQFRIEQVCELHVSVVYWNLTVILLGSNNSQQPVNDGRQCLLSLPVNGIFAVCFIVFFFNLL